MGEVLHFSPPDPASPTKIACGLALEVVRLLTWRRDWNWLVRRQGGIHHACVSSPDYVPLKSGVLFAGIGATPAAALREAREAAQRADTNAVRPDGEA